MDFSLRCNSLKCRKQLNDRAVVTTCSHIFCIPCSESLGLASPNGSTRACPACETQLTNPDDAVVTQLNPTEDYKTSILSGLTPSVIMECAGRGLSFYTYQTTQEIVYQEFLARSLTDKYSTLSAQTDKIISDANTEIMSLQDKLSAMHVEQKNLAQKNEDLAQAFREKVRHQQQLQKLYQRLKQQQLAQGIELAAEHDAEHALHAAGVGNGNSNHGIGVPMHSRASSNGSVGGRRQHINGLGPQFNGRAGLQTSRTAVTPETPSGHRTRLPVPLHSTRGIAIENYEPVRRGTANRPALNSIDPNVQRNNPVRYGMSAGVKMGSPYNGPISRTGGWTWRG